VFRLATISCFVLWCASASAQWGNPYNVPSGGSVKLGFYASVNPDCTAAGVPTLRITQPPRNGRVVIERTRDFVTFPQSNVRSVCNQRRVQGIMVRYISQRGYVGDDSLSGEMFWPSGTLRSGTVYIRVR